MNKTLGLPWVWAGGDNGMLLNCVDTNIWAVYFMLQQKTDYFQTEGIVLLNTPAIGLALERV